MTVREVQFNAEQQRWNYSGVEANRIPFSAMPNTPKGAMRAHDQRQSDGKIIRVWFRQSDSPDEIRHGTYGWSDTP